MVAIVVSIRISESQRDSLDSTPEIYHRLEVWLEALRAHHSLLLERMISWSEVWSDRVEEYEKRLWEARKAGVSPRFNRLGELQGSFALFDNAIVALTYVEEVIESVEILISERPQERKPTGKVSRGDGKSGRAVVRKRGSSKTGRGSR